MLGLQKDNWPKMNFYSRPDRYFGRRPQGHVFLVLLKYRLCRLAEGNISGQDVKAVFTDHA